MSKGIGPQGLGVKGHNGFWVGDASTKSTVKQKSPLKLKDACYKKVKASYKVFPSAYASGAIAKCRKNS
jgi:hypothetical protein